MKHAILITALLATLIPVGLFAASESYGALGAGSKADLNLEQMLTYAIQDESLARSEYEMIIERYGTIRPFSNIIRAEERHIQ